MKTKFKKTILGAITLVVFIALIIEGKILVTNYRYIHTSPYDLLLESKDKPSRYYLFEKELNEIEAKQARKRTNYNNHIIICIFSFIILGASISLLVDLFTEEKN